MKKGLLAVLMLTALSAYADKSPFTVHIASADSSPVALDYGTTYDPTVRYNYGVTVKNISTASQRFTDIWVGSRIWITDNPIVKIHWGIARENTPFDITLKPGEEFKRGVQVETGSTKPVRFRLGFFQQYHDEKRNGPYWSNRVILVPTPAQPIASPDAASGGPHR